MAGEELVKLEYIEKSIGEIKESLKVLNQSQAGIEKCMATLPINYVTSKEHERLISVVETKTAQRDFDELKDTVDAKADRKDVANIWKAFAVAGAVVGTVVSIFDKILGWLQ